MLLPWNAFITATNYFEAKFSNSQYEVGVDWVNLIVIDLNI